MRTFGPLDLEQPRVLIRIKAQSGSWPRRSRDPQPLASSVARAKPANSMRSMCSSPRSARPQLNRVTCTLVLAICCFLLSAANASVQLDLRSSSALQVSQVLRGLYEKGDMVELREMAEQIILENNTEVLYDLRYPTAFQFLGVAQNALGDLAEATATFEQAVKVNPDDVGSWVLLGNSYLLQVRLPEAVAALEVGVLEKGSVKDLHLLFKARNWMASWKDRDDSLAQIQAKHEEALRLGKASPLNALDFAELPPASIMQINRHAYLKPVENDTWLCCDEEKDLRLKSPELRIGFVSSDFGVHPVATLLRGMLALLSGPDHQTSVYCFSLSDASSWWKRNISRTVDYMVSLKGKNPLDAAKIIRSHQIHVLVDLNGHTLHSGLDIFTYRPAPVQVSYLGFPMTIGNPCIDFFLSDSVATPAETSGEIFTEKLLLLPMHYIVNDHLQMLGHTLEGERPTLRALAGQDDKPFVFATFSNWQKMDPSIFSAWMAILARVPSSVMWFLEYSGYDGAVSNLREEAKAHGIDDKRLVFSKLDPWIDHTYMKRAADLVLDTSLKNGHTTLIDTLCAGVPVITLEGSRMSNRAGSSALHALDLQDLTVNSVKEYVEVAVYLATHNYVLQRLRQQVEQNRLTYPLFDTAKYTSKFEESIKAAWQVKKSRLLAGGSAQGMHIFPSRASTTVTSRNFPVLSAKNDNHDQDEYATRVQRALEAQEAIQLHIGGHITHPDWWIVDANDGDRVDFVMRMANLYAFPDNSVSAIYASHVLEHCTHGVGHEIEATLREWHRVLRPNGQLFVAVPDLFVLASLFVNESIPHQDRAWIMTIIFGGQTDIYDIHKVGFDEAILAFYLEKAGFCELTRHKDFGYFRDSTVMVVHGAAISLNVHARACK